MSDEEDEEYDVTTTPGQPEDPTDSMLSLRGGEPGFRLKDFMPQLPTIESIEFIFEEEERRLFEEAEALRLKLWEEEMAALAAAALLAEEEGEEEMTETSVTVELEEEGGEEEQTSEDEFALLPQDAPDEEVKEEVFIGFEEEGKKESIVAVVEEVSEVFVLDPEPIVLDLIYKCVEKAEHKTIEQILRGKLDLKKVQDGIRFVWPKLQRELKKCMLLSRRVREYFRKKKNDRGLAEDNPATVIEAAKKYHDYLIKLDDIKSKRASLNADVEFKLANLLEEEAAYQNRVDSRTAAFIELLKETGKICFSKKTGTFLSERATETIAKRMIELRDAIAELRLSLIKSQHRMAYLSEKARKLEDLGDGLCQADFEQLKAETQGLEDKIEERTNEIVKLRIRCSSDIHTLSNIRQKLDIYRQLTMIQQSTVENLYQTQLKARSELHEVKMARDQLRRQHQALSFSCGILDKPMLMYDYDRTVAKTDEVVERINKLKAQTLAFNKKLDNIEKLMK